MQNDGVLSIALEKISNRIIGIADKVENIRGKKLECLSITMYFLGHILMLLVHEPWFDEALSWLIARDSSLYELLFIAPHYEGHPSLWHLVLAPFAKLGFPYELSLSLVSLVFSGTAAALFVFKSPFKRIIRILAPFTYFFFYQYSVISRPYCMMMLALVLVAITFKKKEDNPGKFVLSLLFLCVTSAYGIVIAGGVTVAWILEMLLASNKKSMLKNSENGETRGTIRIFFTDHLLYKGKIFWLIGLLMYVLFILWRIMPADNAYAIVHGTQKAQNGILVRLLYSAFGLLSDSFITDVYHENDIFQNVNFSYYEYIVGIAIGILLFSLLLRFSIRKKAILEFIISYVLLVLFTLFIYIYPTHIGIMHLFVGFFLWTNCEKEAVPQKNENQLIKSLNIILISLIVLIMLYWNVGSCISDVFYEYSCGNKEYQFLVENGLENCTVYTEAINLEYGSEGRSEKLRAQGYFSNSGVCMAPYMDSGLILNGAENLGGAYACIHELISQDEWEIQNSKYMECETPDVLIGMPETNISFNDGLINISDYIKVFEKRCSTIFKGVPGAGISDIYIRSGLGMKKGIKEID